MSAADEYRPANVRASMLEMFDFPDVARDDAVCEARSALENIPSPRRPLFRIPVDALRDYFAVLNFNSPASRFRRGQGAVIFAFQQVLRIALPVRAGPVVSLQGHEGEYSTGREVCPLG